MRTDRQLIADAAAGDQDGWNQLIERYQRLVYSIPHRGGLPVEGCEDVFQAVFLALVRNLGRLRDAESLPKWLVTTATRESWSWARRHRRETSLRSADGVSEQDAAELLERSELQSRVHRALLEMGGRCERLLRALFLTEPKPSYQSISEHLSIPVGSIGPTRNRCLAKLLQTVDPSLAEELA